MKVRHGSERIVFIFENVVVKIPKNFRGILSNINEIYNWHKYKNDFLCPIQFHTLFLIVMKKAKTLNKTNSYLMDAINYAHYNEAIFNDFNVNNVGLINNRLVKIDYGNWFWLHNCFISLKLFTGRITKK